MRFSGPEIFRILLTLGMLVAVIALTKPCSNAVSTFVMGFDGSGKGSQMPKPGNVDIPGSAGSDPYERLTPGMSEAETKAAIERAKLRAQQTGGSGAPLPPPALQGSAAPGAPGTAPIQGSAGTPPPIQGSAGTPPIQGSAASPQRPPAPGSAASPQRPPAPGSAASPQRTPAPAQGSAATPQRTPAPATPQRTPGTLLQGSAARTQPAPAQPPPGTPLSIPATAAPTTP
jgi:hypothetical protein